MIRVMWRSWQRQQTESFRRGQPNAPALPSARWWLQPGSACNGSRACWPADGKTFKKPRRPFEKERLDAELKTVGEYGLRNKRELWRVQMVLSKLRSRARTLLTLNEKDPK